VWSDEFSTGKKRSLTNSYPVSAICNFNHSGMTLALSSS
jgi:hypothetical protein